MVVSALLLVGTVYLFAHRADGLHPERGHRAAQRTDRSDSGHRLRGDGRASEGSDGHPREGSERRGLHVERRRQRWRASQRRPEAARPAHDDGRPDHRGAAAEAGARPGRARRAVRTRRPSASAACSRARSTSSRCRIPTPRSSIASRPSFEAALRNVPGLHGRHSRPADHATRSSPSISIATRLRRSA